MDGAALSARQDKEAHAMQGLHKTIARVDQLEKLHHFLFVEHTAYNAAGAASARSGGTPSPA